jgi:flagellar protein FliS
VDLKNVDLESRGTDRVPTPAPGELIARLFDAGCAAVREAVDAQRCGAYEAAHARLLTAQDVVAELRAALDPGAGDVAADLDGLYDWCRGLLVRANLSRDPQPALAALEVLQPLGAAWRRACLTRAT